MQCFKLVVNYVFAAVNYYCCAIEGKIEECLGLSSVTWR